MQQAAEQAGSAGLHHALEGFGVAAEVVAGRPGGDQLLDQEDQALTQLAGLDRQLVDQAHQEA
ncbi:hypothetical protein D3C75_1176430 [compost metagenome]